MITTHHERILLASRLLTLLGSTSLAILGDPDATQLVLLKFPRKSQLRKFESALFKLNHRLVLVDRPPTLLFPCLAVQFLRVQSLDSCVSR